MYNRKIGLTKKLKSVAFIVLLITSSVFIAAPAFIPKASAAVTGTVTVSHTKLWGNSTLRIIVNDPDLSGNGAVAPDVKLTITPTGGSAGVAKKLNVTQLSDGTWVAHVMNNTCATISTNNTCATGGWLGQPKNATTGTNSEANGIITGAAAQARVQNSGALTPGRYGLLVSASVAKGIIQVFNFTRLDTITITYNDASGAAGAIAVPFAVTFDYTTGTVANEKTTISPAAILRPQITDSDRNRDPTAKDRFWVNTTASSSIVGMTFVITSANATSGVNGTITGTIRCISTTVTCIELRFDETGLSTSQFELNTTGLNLNFTGPKFFVRNGAQPWKYLQDGDLFRMSFADPDRKLVGTAAATYSFTSTITRKLGVVTYSTASLTYTTDVTIEIADADMNTDSKTKQFFEINVRDSPTAATAKNMRVGETDKDSGIFRGSFRASITNGTTDFARSATSPNATHAFNRITWSVLPGDRPASFVTYKDNITGALTSAVSTLLFVTGTATITLDKSSYAVSDVEATVTVVDPDANDDNGSQEVIQFSSGTGAPNNMSARHLGTGTGGPFKVGVFALVVINGSSARQEIRNFISNAIETSSGSATFTFKVSLTAIRAQTNGLTSSDQLRVSYNRRFDGQMYNFTATIGGTVARISFDRNELPIAPGKRVNFTMSVFDQDINQNPNSAETLTARIYVRNATDGIVGTSKATLAANGQTRDYSFYNVTLMETGSNTANFSLKMFFTWGSSDAVATTIGNYSNPTKAIFNLDRTQDMVAGRIQVCVSDGLGTTTQEAPRATGGGFTTESIKGICRAASFAVHSASMTANVTSGKIGVSVKFALTEVDMNLDITEKDKVALRFAVNKGTSIPIEDVTPELNATLILTESAPNSGVFENETKLGVGTFPYSQVNASQFVRIRYQDDAAPGSTSAAGLVKAKATVSIVIGSTTGTLTLSPATKTGPYNVIVATIQDADLAYNRTGTKGASATGAIIIHKMRAEQTNDELNNYPALKMNRTTGTFTFNITLSYATGAVAGDAILQVNATDRIHIFYNDNLDELGQVKVVEKILDVGVASGVLSTDKTNYLVGQIVTIRLVDIDANTDSTKRNITKVTVYTDSWSAGTDVVLLETAQDSGIFEGVVVIVDVLPGAGQVLGRIGDTITIKYIDPLGDGATKRTITFSGARIGTSVPKTQQVPASIPVIVDSQGRPLTTIRAGDVVNIQATVKNNDTVAHTFTYLVQVKTAAGVVVNLAYIKDLPLAVATSASPSVSWIPTNAGTYTVEVFVWESLTNPIALSPSQKITVTVG